MPTKVPPFRLPGWLLADSGDPSRSGFIWGRYAATPPEDSGLVGAHIDVDKHFTRGPDQGYRSEFEGVALSST